MTFPFAERMRTMKPSTIREMLKMTECPEVISFAGGLPWTAGFALLAAYAAAAVALGPIAMAAACRNALS